MSDDVTFPDDTITAGQQTDPNTGATVSSDGGAVVFPGDTVYPSDSPKQKELDQQVAPTSRAADGRPGHRSDRVSGRQQHRVSGPEHQPASSAARHADVPDAGPSTPSPWDTPTPDPANDPIFGPGGAGPDPQGPDF